MNVDAAAAAITQLKNVQLQGSISTAVAVKMLETVKADADLMMQLLYKSMGVGQNIDIKA